MEHGDADRTDLNGFLTARIKLRLIDAIRVLGNCSCVA